MHYFYTESETEADCDTNRPLPHSKAINDMAFLSVVQ